VAAASQEVPRKYKKKTSRFEFHRNARHATLRTTTTAAAWSCMTNIYVREGSLLSGSAVSPREKAYSLPAVYITLVSCCWSSWSEFPTVLIPCGEMMVPDRRRRESRRCWLLCRGDWSSRPSIASFLGFHGCLRFIHAFRTSFSTFDNAYFTYAPQMATAFSNSPD
jgi:hypothetical protein